jgi:di/tricarboxylate transporter
LSELQIGIVFGLLFLGIIMFAWQRIRYDVVAIIMLLTLGLSGVLSFSELFQGFSSPAVITVASALVIARALQNTGYLDKVAEGLLRFDKRPVIPLFLLLAAISLASGFINDIAALAIALPVGISLSKSLGIKPSKILIPMAYAALIGGGLTLIGTPSNIVAGSIAIQKLGRPIGVFEFTPVGIPVLLSLLFLFLLIGRRVLPVRTSPYETEGGFKLPSYIFEVKASEKSNFLGRTIGELEKKFENTEVVRIIRGNLEREMPHSNTKIGIADTLVVRSDTGDLEKMVKETGLQTLKVEEEEEKTKGLSLTEVIVMSGSPLIGRSASQVHLRDWLHVTLLGISRHGSPLTKKVGKIGIKEGDVLMIETAEADLARMCQELKLAPLRTRGVSLHAYAPPKLTLAIAIASILLGALNIIPINVALALGAVGMLLSKSVSIKEAYDAIPWPILILIGSLIPFGIAMETTGADIIIAEAIVQMGVSGPIVALIVVYVTTNLLSNVMNNVAATVFMAPVALRLGETLGIAGFPLLMGVAFAAAMPFMTPISHKCNLLVMEAGGYRFTDYLRLGIPLTLVAGSVVILLVPLLWPF